MSGLLIIAPLLASVSSAFLWLALRVARVWCKQQWLSQSGCLLPLLAFPLLTVAYALLLSKSMTAEGYGSNSQEANAHLLTFDVPAAASDVNFRHAFFSGLIDEANFLLSEDKFRAWADENNWSLREFVTDANGFRWLSPEGERSRAAFVLVTAFPGDGIVELANGYTYDDFESIDSDSGLRVVYDKDSQRVYMWRTTY